MSTTQHTRLVARLHLDLIAQYCKLVWKIEWDTGPCQVDSSALPKGFELCVDPERELAVIIPVMWYADNKALQEILGSWDDWLDCYAEVLVFELPRNLPLRQWELAQSVLQRESTLTFTTAEGGQAVADLYMFHWPDEFLRAVGRVIRIWEDNEV